MKSLLKNLTVVVIIVGVINLITWAAWCIQGLFTEPFNLSMIMRLNTLIAGGWILIILLAVELTTYEK